MAKRVDEQELEIIMRDAGIPEEQRAQMRANNAKPEKTKRHGAAAPPKLDLGGI